MRTTRSVNSRSAEKRKDEQCLGNRAAFLYLLQNTTSITHETAHGRKDPL